MYSDLLLYSEDLIAESIVLPIGNYSHWFHVRFFLLIKNYRLETAHWLFSFTPSHLIHCSLYGIYGKRIEIIIH